MRRLKKSWLTSFVEYASHSEAPPRMHFFAGVGAISGALRRKVYIDQYFFKWFPSFYIIFVAPPGVVSKSTTADMAMDLLKEVPGIKFGPDVVTWPALVTAFATSSEFFELNEEHHPMCALTLVASELGNLLNPQDRDMVNLFINLWDGRKTLEKLTKTSGNDTIENPFINMLGCTTPHWIADNMPSVTVGGGFTSRCIFVYAERKEKLVAYPILNKDIQLDSLRNDLIHDLEIISMNLAGEYVLTPEAYAWGTEWYETLWRTSRPLHLEDDRLDGYIARKQTHIHKLAMVIAASDGDEMVITADQLKLANIMLETVEPDLVKVFSKLGKTDDALQVDRFLAYIQAKGTIPYTEAYRLVHSHFYDMRDFEGVIAGAVQAGFIKMLPAKGGIDLQWCAS